MEKLIIRKIWIAKGNGTKYITVPKNCELVEGNYVKLVKIDEFEPEFKTEQVNFNVTKNKQC